MTEPLTVVSGIARTGSSLCMQMCIAAGLRPTGKAHYPYWEDGRTSLLPKVFEWVSEVPPGSVLKCLNPAVKPLPRGPAYRWIWCSRRNKKHQKKSIRKFVDNANKREPGRLIAKDIDIQHDSATSLALIRALGGPVLHLVFEDMLEKRRATAARLAAFIGRGDIDTMVRCIVDRPTKCLDYMLEDGWVRKRVGE